MNRLDLVIFGASGFTGKHVVQELSRIGKSFPDITWAIAGRNLEKLKSVLDNVTKKTGTNISSTKIITADVNDKESLKSMCNQAKVLINCCGPFVKYGESVVAEAIKCKTHYVDVSGETQFIELLEQNYEQPARDANVYVINACGLSSVPVDLGVLYLEKYFDGTLNSVESYLITHFSDKMMAETRRNGIVRYSSWESVINSMAYVSFSKLQQNPIVQVEPELKRRCLIHKNLNKWCVPFPGADSRVVFKTQSHLASNGKRPVQFKPYIAFPSMFIAIGTIIGGLFLFIFSKISFIRKFMLNYPRLCSFGVVTYGDPKEGVLDESRFQYELVGAGWSTSDACKDIDKRLVARINVSGVDPAYVGTAVILIFSAVTILQEQHKMPAGGGVLTPGIAFQNTNILKHLQENNITIEIIKNDQ